MKIACIGAGASGLFFSLNCADEGHEVTLFDGNEKVGRKMYISGKGRCNISNDCDVKEFIGNVVRNPRFLYSALNRFKPEDTIAFFNEHGCPLKTERGKRVFPVSDRAADIIDCLFRECRRKKVAIRFKEKVSEIFKEGDHFVLLSADKRYLADKVVIATGGLSYPSTGSTGDGYKFAEHFGHKIIEPAAALCPIRVREKIDPEMLKLTLKNVALRAISDQFDQTFFGDLEFVKDGISGPIVLSLSSLINRLGKVDLILDLKPALDAEKLDKRLLRELQKNPNQDLAYLLKTLLPDEFLPFFVRETKTEEKTVLNSLSKEKRKKLLQDLKQFHFTYDGLYEVEKGIVTSGGVDVHAIDPKTLESKLCEGLYFIGEVLDVDALTGGFNLQIALATGYSCAMAIKAER